MVEAVPSPFGAPVRDSRLMRWMVFVATGLFFWSAGGAFLIFGAPKYKVNCTMENHDYTLAHFNHETGQMDPPTNQDDFYVTCTISAGEKQIYLERLVLAHPTEYMDAARAVNEFRTKGAAKIILEKEGKKDEK